VTFVPTEADPPLQAVLYEQSGDPWRVMVACVLLNATNRARADRVWPELFARWPDARSFANGDRHSQGEILRPLGLGRQRARRLRAMSIAWLVRFPTGYRSTRRELADLWARVDVHAYPGLGDYAADSFRLFVLGDLTVEPRDRVVRAWRDMCIEHWWRLCRDCLNWTNTCPDSLRQIRAETA